MVDATFDGVKGRSHCVVYFTTNADGWEYSGLKGARVLGHCVYGI